MKKKRLLFLSPLILLGVLIVSQWLGTLAWHRELDALFTWVNELPKTSAGAIVSAPYAPDIVAYQAPRPPQTSAILELGFNCTRFRWTSWVLPQPSYDSLLVTVRTENGHLIVKAHYGSD